MQPLNTLDKIVVAVPSKAQFEPGFYRWNERLCRLAENLECRIEYHGRHDTTELIDRFIRHKHADLRVSYIDMEHWNMFPVLASGIKDDDLFVVITARKGTVSYKDAQDKLSEELTNSFSGRNFLIVFPDQHGDLMEEMTFSQSQHTEGKSAYESLRDFVCKRILHKNR